MLMFRLFSVQFAPFANYLTNRVQKHIETALDTPRNGGVESSFLIKVLSTVYREALVVREIP